MLERAKEILPPKKYADLRAPVSARDWEAAVGSRIATRAMPAKLDRGVLHVRVTSSTWAQELSLLSDPILAQLRARGVPVDSLRFRVGKVDVPDRAKVRDDHVRTSPAPVALTPSLYAEVARVPDAELRDAIRHAAEKNLGWQRMIGRTNTADETNVRPDKLEAIPPKPGARDPRSVGPETSRPDRAEEPASASPRRTRGTV